MNTLLPIIRRKRRPLVTEPETVVAEPMKQEPENLTPPIVEKPAADTSEDAPEN